MKPTRRGFLENSAAIASSLIFAPAHAIEPLREPVAHEPSPPAIKVVVWDEQQPAQKQAYRNFLGNQIADHLGRQPGLSVRSVNINEPGQGLAAGVLDDCQVLIWWGHVRNGDIAPEVGQAIVSKIKAGQLGLIALHSAHWSTPFVEAMYERTRLNMAPKLKPAIGEHVDVSYVLPSPRYVVPKPDARLTPYVAWEKFPGEYARATVHLPFCCFPAYRGDGKLSEVRVLRKEHPIVAGVPARFTLPQTEMYAEPFHVPEPDQVILEERWASGEWFRSGAVWKLGKGRVFYFRPGHETYPIYTQPIPLQILTNATRWLASAAE